ncbi:MAG: DUF3618 domain-containing protein [Vicinamibacterales bacterium]
MDDTSRRVTRQKRSTAAAAGVTEPVTDQSLPDKADARALELREEIADTRTEMAETIEAIQERLTPANIAAQAGETVRNAATEKVKQMANTAGEAMDQVLDNSFVDTLRANPVPAAMIGLGVAWLFARRRSEPQVSRYQRSSYRPSPSYQGSTSGYNTAYDSAGRSAEYGEYGAVGTRGTFGSQSSAGPERSSDTGQNFADTALQTMENVRDSARQTTYRARLQFDDVLRNNPLALGAAAAVIGAVVGMSVPQTETENEFMGEARDTVVDRARGLADDAANKVSQAAGQLHNAGATGGEWNSTGGSQPGQPSGQGVGTP